MSPDNAVRASSHASNVGGAAPGPTNSESVDALLSLFPGPVTLSPDRAGAWRGLALTFIFIVTAAVLSRVLPAIATKHMTFVFVILSGWALFMAVRLLPGAFRLTLDKDGFERVWLFLAFRRPWQRADAMTIWRMAHRQIVRYRPSAAAGRDNAAARFTKAEGGRAIGEVVLFSDGCSLSANEFTALMSRWRALASGQ